MEPPRDLLQGGLLVPEWEAQWEERQERQAGHYGENSTLVHWSVRECIENEPAPQPSSSRGNV